MLKACGFGEIMIFHMLVAYVLGSTIFVAAQCVLGP
jgi:hypothetical protein